VLASSEEQARLIDGLLALASTEAGLESQDPVDLATSVNVVVGDAQSEIDRLGIHLNVATAAAPLKGDQLLIERLVANLLANAVQHNVPNGRIEVVTRMEDGQAVLSVSNTGQIVPADEVD